MLRTHSQRKKFDTFEGETYTPTPVIVIVLDHAGNPESEVEADMCVWNRNLGIVSSEPWSFEEFVKERLEDWLDVYDVVELIGDEE